MKNWKALLALMLSAFMLTFTACDEDEEQTKGIGIPVYGEDFVATVDGNNVTLACSMTAATSVIWEINGKEYTANPQIVNLPMKGDYTLVLNVSADGLTYYESTAATVTIASTDMAPFQTGVWKALTGGQAGYNKTWVLDLVEVVSTTIDDAGVSTSSSTYKSSFFHNPLDFYGDAEAGGAADNIWGPWGGTNIYGWGGTPEVGEISFDCAEGKAKLTMTDGVNGDGTAVAKADGTGYEYGKNATAKNGAFEGTFSMTTVDRDPAFCMFTDGTTSLWKNFIDGKYSYLGSLSSQTATIQFAEGLRFPMDKGRVGEGQFQASDLQNVMVMHCSDSALIIRVKRSLEGYDAAGIHKTSTCWLLYNYVVKGYNYGVKQPITHPVKSIAKADLVGSWKLASVSGNWIGWAAKNELNTWADGTAMAATFAGWNATTPTEKLTASTKVTLTFNNDGTCVIHDVTYDGAAEVVNEVSTTYTVSNGYVTFGASVSITGFTGMISLSGTNVYALDVTASTDGIWLGKNNGTKEESTAIHMIKQ